MRVLLIALLAAISYAQTVFDDIVIHELEQVFSVQHPQGLEYSGEINLSFSADQLRISWILTSYDERCNSGAGAAPGSCAIWLYNSMSSCSYSNNFLGSTSNIFSQWRLVTYDSSTGSTKIPWNFSPEDTLGRPLVLHDFDGVMASCNNLARNFRTSSVDQLEIYPGANINAEQSYDGTIDITFHLNWVLIMWDLRVFDKRCTQGIADTTNSCGIHIHSGRSCASHEDVQGHFYEASLSSDPWLNVAYNSSTGAAELSTGYNYDQTVGRTLVIHDKRGDRMTCNIIPASDGQSEIRGMDYYLLFQADFLGIYERGTMNKIHDAFVLVLDAIHGDITEGSEERPLHVFYIGLITKFPQELKTRLLEPSFVQAYNAILDQILPNNNLDLDEIKRGISISRVPLPVASTDPPASRTSVSYDSDSVGDDHVWWVALSLTLASCCLCSIVSFLCYKCCINTLLKDQTETLRVGHSLKEEMTDDLMQTSGFDDMIDDDFDEAGLYASDVVVSKKKIDLKIDAVPPPPVKFSKRDSLPDIPETPLCSFDNTNENLLPAGEAVFVHRDSTKTSMTDQLYGSSPTPSLMAKYSDPNASWKSSGTTPRGPASQGSANRLSLEGSDTSLFASQEKQSDAGVDVIIPEKMDQEGNNTSLISNRPKRAPEKAEKYVDSIIPLKVHSEGNNTSMISKQKRIPENAGTNAHSDADLDDGDEVFTI